MRKIGNSMKQLSFYSKLLDKQTEKKSVASAPCLPTERQQHTPKDEKL